MLAFHEDLVDALCRTGRIVSPAVERAFRDVPRHVFLPGVPLEQAYADDAVATKTVAGVLVSSASQPSMVAIMLEQLAVRPGHRVLEVGAGTGYNAALLARLAGPAGAVTAVDIDQDIVDGAARHLAAAGVGGVALACGDGAVGHPGNAPYDRIVLTVGAWDVQPAWVTQLAVGGRLLLPLSVCGSQLSVALDLVPGGELRSASVRGCGFVRLRGAGAGPDTSAELDPDGLSVQFGERPAGPVADAVRAALARPGKRVGVGVRVGSLDLWDGLGLWLAVTEPDACRLLAAGKAARTALGRRLGPLGGSVALHGPAGLAALVRTGPGRVAVQAFGDPQGRVERLAAGIDAWVARGRPTAADLRIRVRPRGAPVPDGVPAVHKDHATVLLDWPA